MQSGPDLFEAIRQPFQLLREELTSKSQILYNFFPVYVVFCSALCSVLEISICVLAEDRLQGSQCRPVSEASVLCDTHTGTSSTARLDAFSINGSCFSSESAGTKVLGWYMKCGRYLAGF